MAEIKVDTQHPDYADNLDRWLKNRNFCEGQKAVKGQTTLYLPMREQEEASAYAERLAATNFYNGTGRTLAGYIGALFRKQPNIKLDSISEEYREDLTGNGESIGQFARKVATEILKVNRGGILIDRDIDAVGDKTRGAYLAFYDAEQIVNWKTNRIDGQDKLTLLVLKETILDPEQDDQVFGQEKITRWRVLRIEGGKYTVTIHHQDLDNSTLYQIGEPIMPTKGGAAMDYIPFIPFSTAGISIDVQKPILDDLVEVNHGHYLNSSQYEHVLKFAGNPMLFIKDPSRDEESDPVIVGSSRAYIATDPQADAKYIELSGTSIPAIQEAMADKEKRMAVLGARLLEEQKAGTEAAETVRLRQAGEGGILGDMATALSQVMSKVVEWLVAWDFLIEPQVEIIFSRDFATTRLGSADMVSLIQARQSGLISQDTFLYQMQQGEIIQDGITIEEEKTRIESQKPDLGMGLDEEPDDEEEEPEEDEDA